TAAPCACSGAVAKLPGVATVLGLTAILCFGVRGTAVVNRVAVAFKVGNLLVIVGAGLVFVRPAHWHPFVPDAQGFGRFGWSGVLFGARAVFWVFIGFDAVSTLTQESRHPDHDAPVGILASIGLCTVLYVLVALTITGLVS